MVKVEKIQFIEAETEGEVRKNLDAFQWGEDTYWEISEQ